MVNTSLCYIKHNDSYLMIHRNKKPGDYNKDKWIGIGGKFLDAESPEECVCREVYEETKIELSQTDVEYRGIVTFVCEDGKTCEVYSEFMHLFYVDLDNLRRKGKAINGDTDDTKSEITQEIILPECDEGTLEWVPVSRMNELPHWKGDEIFLRLLAENAPFFSLKLSYRDGLLLSAALNGKSLPM